MEEQQLLPEKIQQSYNFGNIIKTIGNISVALIMMLNIGIVSLDHRFSAKISICYQNFNFSRKFLIFWI